MKIYVASSWRNRIQQIVVRMLRSMNHEVYDYRHPAPGNDGFSWSEIDPNWRDWTPAEYARALAHPIAKRGFDLDITALRECDACVLVLPSGRSASWEFGYAVGQGKFGAVLMLDKCEPELMYREQPILTSFHELEKLFAADAEVIRQQRRPLPLGISRAEIYRQAVFDMLDRTKGREWVTSSDDPIKDIRTIGERAMACANGATPSSDEAAFAHGELFGVQQAQAVHPTPELSRLVDEKSAALLNRKGVR